MIGVPDILLKRYWRSPSETGRNVLVRLKLCLPDGFARKGEAAATSRLWRCQNCRFKLANQGYLAPHAIADFGVDC
jgi:hypothetical protein